MPKVAEHPELGLWATIYRPTGRFIGRCGLIPWTIDNQQETEVAYLLAKELWGQGLGAEAAGALVRHAFMRLQLIRLIALIDRENTASIRTAEKVGFSFEREVEVEGTKAQLYSLAPVHGQCDIDRATVKRLPPLLLLAQKQTELLLRNLSAFDPKRSSMGTPQDRVQKTDPSFFEIA